MRSSSGPRPISGSSFPAAARSVRFVAKAASGSAETSPGSPAPSSPPAGDGAPPPRAPVSFDTPWEM